MAKLTYNTLNITSPVTLVNNGVNLQSVITFCASWDFMTTDFEAKLALSFTPCINFDLNDTS